MTRRHSVRDSLFAALLLAGALVAGLRLLGDGRGVQSRENPAGDLGRPAREPAVVPAGASGGGVAEVRRQIGTATGTRVAAGESPSASGGPATRRGRFVTPAGTPNDELVKLVANFPWTYDPARTVELAPDGSFVLRAVPEGPVTFQLTARYLRLRGDQAALENGVLVLRPELGGRLEGRVESEWSTEHGSEPEVWIGRLPASTAEWVGWRAGRSGRRPIGVARALCTDGAFTFDALPAVGRLLVEARAAGGLVAREVLTLAPGDARWLVLTTEQAASLAGTLVGSVDEDPFEYQLRIDRSQPGGAWRTVHESQFTELDGSFRVDGLRPGRLRLTARGPTYGELVVDLPPGRTDGLVLALGASAALEGTVAWDDGAALDLDRDELELVCQHPVAGVRRVSLDTGEFRLEGLTSGERYTLSASYTGRDEGCLAVIDPFEVVAPAAGLLLTLPRPATIAGRVLGPDGTPAPGAWVRGVAGGDVAAERDGTFRARVRGGVVALTALAEGFYSGPTLQLELAPGETRTGIELELGGAEAVLRGQLLGQDGAPLPRTLLLVTIEAVLEQRVSTTAVRTDGRAEFRLTEQRPGPVLVTAVPLYTVNPPRSLEVEVTDDGWLQLPSQRAGPVEVLLRAAEESFVRLALTRVPR